MPKSSEFSGITVGELIDQLKAYPRSTPIQFGPYRHFTYYRVKNRGDAVQIEFNQVPDDHYTLLPNHAETLPIEPEEVAPPPKSRRTRAIDAARKKGLTRD